MTLRLHKATLRHYMSLPEQSWHSQVNEDGLDLDFGFGWVGQRAGAPRKG